ncbi:lipoprotein LpqV [Mycobacterium sp. Y57]|uniref:lipoprotein LpqV n=1 Tax=Mycolicibacterium xanthum TaxID=2796469 RepID=UPI001C851407|nr:lipoprotein LpqV [Mycolicibacterium xanthum]MBX7433538.1 lipoprotein LpqV [Mycolicibacterium xanthum]
MRRYPLGAVSALAAGSVILSGCGSGTAPEPAPQRSASAPAPTMATSTSLPPDGVGVSPGGVTTAVGAPAESTEDDYFQACLAARTWMEQQGGDLARQVEPYLKMLQDSQNAGLGTFGRPWSGLSAGEQSAVIVAVRAAADALCG